LEPGKIAGDGVVEVDFAGVAQLHKGGGGEEFTVRGHAEFCDGRHGNLGADVGETESLGPDKLLIKDDADRHSG